MDGMNRPGTPTTTSSAAPIDPASDAVAAADLSIWDTLGDEDRASIERGLAQSLAGIHATDEEVEAAFATFGP